MGGSCPALIIKLGWKGNAVANTPAYYHMATIRAVKSFEVQGQYSQHLFFFVTYECT
jgi:hypothetical protein